MIVPPGSGLRCAAAEKLLYNTYKKIAGLFKFNNTGISLNWTDFTAEARVERSGTIQPYQTSTQRVKDEMIDREDNRVL